MHLGRLPSNTGLEPLRYLVQVVTALILTAIGYAVARGLTRSRSNAWVSAIIFAAAILAVRSCGIFAEPSISGLFAAALLLASASLYSRNRVHPTLKARRAALWIVALTFVACLAHARESQVSAHRSTEKLATADADPMARWCREPPRGGVTTETGMGCIGVSLAHFGMTSGLQHAKAETWFACAAGGLCALAAVALLRDRGTRRG